MTAHAFSSYLENEYLETPYLVDAAVASDGFQFDSVRVDNNGMQFDSVGADNNGMQFDVVNNVDNDVGVQFDAIINALKNNGMQFDGVVGLIPATGMEFLADISVNPDTGVQFFATINDALKNNGIQFLSEPESIPSTGIEFFSNPNRTQAIGVQFDGIINALNNNGVEFKADTLSHTTCPPGVGYLELPYLDLPYNYLAPFLCAHLGMQFDVVNNVDDDVGVQFNGIIESLKEVGIQFDGIINALNNNGIQFDAVAVDGNAIQVLAAIYNTSNLRIMCEFPSRGTAALLGLNWTANSTATSSTDDFTVNNLNTDITEQVWRSADTVKTGLQLDCDTGLTQGVFLDTFAALNTNLTTSATVQLLGSTSPTFAPIGVTINLTVESDGTIVHLAEDLPINGYRYWRLSVDDITNQNNFIEIGVVVFGPAVIFQEECFVDQVTFTPLNFTDEVFTEGHTNIQNDRGIKNKLRLDFRNLNFSAGNFEKLEDIFNSARTILKCLWIPTPQFPTRFLTFGKLTKLPEQKHNVKGEEQDYVTLTVEVDESK